MISSQGRGTGYNWERRPWPRSFKPWVLRMVGAADRRLGLQLPDLDLRHRCRAWYEDRIRVSKDTGLMNLPSGVRSESNLVRHRGLVRLVHV